ncbi:hypothetical protein PIB30_090176 [Stylosanthes scabra]|uniref:Uncharacterized protein n=1 Tax=Stylosanthes scabra TaxID=79078 RepID=A0ABU6YT58_9FABA|nr:hypothetical protein [Stylosanthes scabra]
MSDSDETVFEQPPPLKEIRSNRRFDHAVVGSNAPLNPTQQSVAFAGKRKNEVMEIRKPKKGTAKGKADETMHEVVRSASEAGAGSSNRTRMFDSFDTVSLGRDDITPTQPS